MEHSVHSESSANRARRVPRRGQHQIWAALSAMVLIGGVIVLAAPEAGAQGSTYYVGNVGAGPSGASDCASNTNTDCTLDDAETAFNNDSSGVTDTIDFIAPSGTYGTLGAPLSSPINPATLIINGNGATNTVVTGAGANQVFVVNSGGVVAISGLTVEDGAAAGAPGAGIMNSGVVTLTNAVVTGNHATGMGSAGGGIANVGSLALSGVTVSNNSAGAGGGIASIQGSATIDGSQVTGNSAPGGGGGIVSGTMGTGPSGTLTVNDSQVTGNTTGGGGGGILNHAGTATITNSEINGNVGGTPGSGGGGGGSRVGAVTAA